MNILPELKDRFRSALADLVSDPDHLASMVRPAQDPRFGDYQANCAMPLGKQLGKPPREIAGDIVSRLDVADMCEAPEIAGPGFINLRLKPDWLNQQVNAASRDQRLGVTAASTPRKYVVDFSSPNVAKPMHVGHIRSTVIGDALCHILRFLGHQVTSDNHLGDWGTQFGMIIYGYKHFVDRGEYEVSPVAELGRLYKLVNQLVEYHAGIKQLPVLNEQLEAHLSAAQLHADATSVKPADKAAKKARRRLNEKVTSTRLAIESIEEKTAVVDNDPTFAAWAAEHPNIGAATQHETALLHSGDATNRQLWEEFLPACRKAIERIYDRIDVTFDFELGESFYQDRLADVVVDLESRGLAKESEGATCIFLDAFDTPMIIRKKDGAFLYATTDLATIQYRVEEWQVDEILYVVDHRQSEHFSKLFAVVELWGISEVELRHISFGTVLGKDGKPFKTRSGATVGLEGLLDEAVQRARTIVADNDDAKKNGPELSEQERDRIAGVIGHAAIKYADLSHNRTSDYEFDEEKMVAMQGNTATYMQYSYARINGIFRRGNVDVAALHRRNVAIRLDDAHERALALALLKFSDALAETIEDYRPNVLTGYLYELTKVFSGFFEHCPVLKADNEISRDSRLLLCDLTGRTIRKGLGLLGIDVVERM